MFRSIATFLTVVQSYGAVVVLKVNWRHRRARLSTMKINVDATHAFAWMRQYAAYRPFFLIIIILGGHLICMAVIM